MNNNAAGAILGRGGEVRSCRRLTSGKFYRASSRLHRSRVLPPTRSLVNAPRDLYNIRSRPASTLGREVQKQLESDHKIAIRVSGGDSTFPGTQDRVRGRLTPSGCRLGSGLGRLGRLGLGVRG